jgi:uncharacterized protein involved in exopolysaccharide biosynthesis
VALLRQRRTVLAFTGAGLVLAIVVAALRVATYSASFSFVPQVTQDQSRSGLASLAGQLGVSLLTAGSQGQSPQLYADLLETREILIPIAVDSFRVAPYAPARVALSEFLGVPGTERGIVVENTVNVLRSSVVSATVATRTTGVVSVRVRTRSAQVSFEIAERLLHGLNQFNLVTRRSQATAERQFTEGRLEATRRSLRAAEDALQRFLQSNRQFANSAELTFERDRLQREVSLQQQVDIGLAQQYEESRIREVRDTPVITVIEQPALPASADPRERSLVLLTLTLLGFLLGIAASLIRDSIQRRIAESSDPTFNLLVRQWYELPLIRILPLRRR